MKITQKARFSGVCFLFCGQSTRLQDGFDPGMRVNLTTVISPTATLHRCRRAAGRSEGLPRDTGKHHATGNLQRSRPYQLPGMKPVIYKGFYEENQKQRKSYSDLLRERLTAIRPPEAT